jgi:hypothetical protein
LHCQGNCCLHRRAFSLSEERYWRLHKESAVSKIVGLLEEELDGFTVVTSFFSIGNLQNTGTVYFPLLEEDQGAVSVFQRKLLHFRLYADFSSEG